jgi:hypothetical protein
MRKSIVALLATLLTLGLLAPAATAGDDDDKRGKKKGGGATELTLYATEDAATLITREGEVLEGEEESPPNVGDRFVATETVYADEDRTEEVGRNHIDCTVTEASGGFPEEPEAEEEPPSFTLSLLCSGVLTLADQGDLSWSGVTTFTEESEGDLIITVAITGGTGDLLGSSGEVAIFDESGDDEEAGEGDDVLSRYEVTLLDAKRGKKGRR